MGDLEVASETMLDGADAVATVDQILRQAMSRRASDVHIEPTAEGCEVRMRVDGLLAPAYRLSRAAGRGVVIRLMVMAQLLTYRLDIPQEGRLVRPSGGASANQSTHSPGDMDDAGAGADLRLSIIPTTHGLRAAVRMPAELGQPRTLAALKLPEPVQAGLAAFAESEAGMLLLTGPAGSGKTTTIYALLSHIVATQPGLSIIALEDPVERDLPGVTQIEVSAFGEMTYQRALRSIVRQDPQVLALGEIRDAETASIAVEAALSGHRLISTLHASDPAGAVARLLEMGLKRYQVTSALFGVVTQRLVRRLRVDGGDGGAVDGLGGDGAGPSRYAGRAPVATFAQMDESLRTVVLEGADAAGLRQAIERSPGHVSLRDAAAALVAAGVTDDAEVIRVLGRG